MHPGGRMVGRQVCMLLPAGLARVRRQTEAGGQAGVLNWMRPDWIAGCLGRGIRGSHPHGWAVACLPASERFPPIQSIRCGASGRRGHRGDGDPSLPIHPSISSPQWAVPGWGGVVRTAARVGAVAALNWAEQEQEQEWSVHCGFEVRGRPCACFLAPASFDRGQSFSSFFVAPSCNWSLQHAPSIYYRRYSFPSFKHGSQLINCSTILSHKCCYTYDPSGRFSMCFVAGQPETDKIKMSSGVLSRSRTTENNTEIVLFQYLILNQTILFNGSCYPIISYHYNQTHPKYNQSHLIAHNLLVNKNKIQ